MKFACSGCGACCRRIGAIARFVKGTPFEFPHKWSEDGVCEHLKDDNTCGIYDDRPLVCRVDQMAELSGTSKEEFYSRNAKACNQLIAEDGIPENYLVDETYKTLE